MTLSRPIGILDEHPEWSRRLMAALEARGLPFEKIDHSNHAFDPRDRTARYSVIVNRTSPSSHVRGHRGVLFYAEALLSHYEELGVPVINPVTAYRFEKSKALQLGLFERLGIRYPRAVVINHPDQVLKWVDRIGFPLLMKPNVGGSGAGIVRFDTRESLEVALDRLDFGPDHTALLQEYVEPEDQAIIRIEVLDGRFLYAIRIVKERESHFNLCPADLCEVPGGESAACPVVPTQGMSVRRVEPPPEAIETALRIATAASIDIGGVEYLVGQADGQRYFYDVNATSNFVTDAPAVLGFDPFPAFVDFIVAVAARNS